jgi:DNA replication protein DnaC
VIQAMTNHDEGQLDVREHHAPLPDVYALIAAGRTRDAWTCKTCPAIVEHPGICHKCAALDEAAQFVEFMRPARETIPERFRWATLREPDELAQHVSRAAIDATLRLVSNKLPPSIAFVGQSGWGKTVLACAVLRRVHDAAKIDSTWLVARMASSAIFIAAQDLAREAVSRIPRKTGRNCATIFERACDASIVVLDDVGQSSDRTDVAAEVIAERHNRSTAKSARGRVWPTIVTTALSREQAQRRYGDGYARAYDRVVAL